MLTFEETELMSGFFYNNNEYTREAAILRLEAAIKNTENDDLTNIAGKVVEKLKAMDDASFEQLVKRLPEPLE